jgi:NADH-quinone oxidoreductase subunit G
VLRVLGNLLDVEGFDYMSPEDVTKAASDAIGAVEAGLPSVTHAPGGGKLAGFLRVSETALYGTDPLVRRASSLQATADAVRQAAINIHPDDAARLGLVDGGEALARQGEGSVTLAVRIDEGVPPGTVFVAAGGFATANLGARLGAIEIEAIRANRAEGGKA